MSKKMVAALLCASLAVPAYAQQDFGGAFPSLSSGASKVVPASANSTQQAATSDNSAAGQGANPAPNLAPKSPVGFPAFPAAGFAASTNVNPGAANNSNAATPGFQELANQAQNMAQQSFNQQAQALNQQANAVRANAQQAANQQIQSLNQRATTAQNMAQQAINQRALDAQALAQQKMGAMGFANSASVDPGINSTTVQPATTNPSSQPAFGQPATTGQGLAQAMSQPSAGALANASTDDATAAQLESTIRELEAAHAHTYNTLGSLLDKVPQDARPVLQQAMETSRQGYEKAKGNRERMSAYRLARSQGMGRDMPSYGQSSPMVQPGQMQAGQMQAGQMQPGQVRTGSANTAAESNGRGGFPGRIASGPVQPSFSSPQFNAPTSAGSGAGFGSTPNMGNTTPPASRSNGNGQGGVGSPSAVNPTGPASRGPTGSSSFGQGFPSNFGTPNPQAGGPVGGSSTANGRLPR
jgi:hypothetical protein